MELVFAMGYAPPGTNPYELIEPAREAERPGTTPPGQRRLGTGRRLRPGLARCDHDHPELGAGIMQIPARMPATTAMTAVTLDLMSGGRVLPGSVLRGPQVAEGWHGQPFGKPLGRTREDVEIVRAAIRRDLVEHEGTTTGFPTRRPTRPGSGSR